MASEQELDEMSTWLRRNKRVSYAVWSVIEWSLGWLIAVQQVIEDRHLLAVRRDMPAQP